MTTTVFTNIGTQVGSSLIKSTGMRSIPLVGNPASNFVRSQFRNLGAYAGNKLAEEIFGVETINTVKGGRLTDLTVQTSSYGETIPLVFGKVKISGNIIWATDIKETPVTTEVSGGGKGGTLSPTRRTQTSYDYKVSIAIALCEGEINSIDRIWADSDLVNLSEFCASFTLHTGSQTQLPDTIIEAIKGVGNTPAYRGLTYVVIEDLDLNAFGNRIPNFSFEVNRAVSGSFGGSEKIEDMVTGINIIPGSGEFVYDTIIQKKIFGVEVDGRFIQRGGSEIVNMNNASKKADVLVSLDQLEQTFPNLEWVSIVCTWFANSLDANVATIQPRVEYKTSTITQPDLWSVAGYNRASAPQVTLDENNNPIYGGTPSDSSVLRLIDELKLRGYKVLFLPMIFMDIADKPWRGRMTCTPAQMNNFFTKTNGYNNYILHYANLTRNKVDAFIIGTEMKGLTQVQNGANFPAVTEFVNLAAQVKTIMGATTKVSYAADWSEYHSINGWYNLDSLWASPNIDFIGIDAYFPLTNRPQNNIYNLQEVMDGWTSGEGYDFYFTNPERTEQASLTPLFAWKNIAWWWSNNHTNPNSVQTAWVPQSKKIWFVEYGFPSVDGATNQPNVFYNPQSSENALPYFSEGQNDFIAQRLGIEATLRKWQNSNMIEEKLLWTWDARPYPFWPDLLDVWSDGGVWSKGHWVNGKLGGASLNAVITEICKKCNIEESEIDISNLQRIVDGYVLNSRVSGSSAIEKLADAYFFDHFETNAKLKFSLNGNEEEDDLVFADIAKSDEVLQKNFVPETLMPSKIDINFINSETSYAIGASSESRDSASLNQKYETNLPLVLTSSRAKNIAEISLLDLWVSRKTYNFSLPINYIYLDVADVINLQMNNGDIEKIKIQKINYSKNKIDIVGRAIDKNIYNLLDYEDFKPSGNTTILNPEIETKFEILDISALAINDLNNAQLKFAISGSSASWGGAQIFYSTDDLNYISLGTTQVPAIMGNTINQLGDAHSFIFDDANQLEVFLINGSLQSVTRDQVLSGSNFCLVGDEIIQFKEAEFLGANHYMLKGLLRGRLGTENKTANHLAAERFVFLNNFILNFTMPKNLIGSDLYFKIASFGQNLNSVTPVLFNYKANNLKPYFPVKFEAQKSGNDIIFSWVRRSRDISGWRNLVDISLAEVTEKYEISILSGSNIVRTAQAASPSFTYSEAMQIADFSSAQTTVKARVSQVSDELGLGGYNEKTFVL